MAAENQANVKFSYKKYYSFRNRINTKFSEKFYSDMRVTDVTRALCYGDTQPAVVVSVEPLLIAAYSDEMDAVAMLLFPSDFAERYGLRPGSRLTTSNIYFRGTKCAADLFPGANFSHQFSDFMPIVQLFLGKKDEKIKKKSSCSRRATGRESSSWQASTAKHTPTYRETALTTSRRIEHFTEATHHGKETDHS